MNLLPIYCQLLASQCPLQLSSGSLQSCPQTMTDLRYGSQGYTPVGSHQLVTKLDSGARVSHVHPM